MKDASATMLSNNMNSGSQSTASIVLDPDSSFAKKLYRVARLYFSELRIPVFPATQASHTDRVRRNIVLPGEHGGNKAKTARN